MSPPTPPRPPSAHFSRRCATLASSPWRPSWQTRRTSFPTSASTASQTSRCVRPPSPPTTRPPAQSLMRPQAAPLTCRTLRWRPRGTPPRPACCLTKGRTCMTEGRSCRPWNCPARRSTALMRTETSCSVWRRRLPVIKKDIFPPPPQGRPSEVPARSDAAEGEAGEVGLVAPCGTPNMEFTQATPEETWKETVPEENSDINATEEAPGVPDASSCSHPILASVGTAEDTVPHIDVAPKDTHDPAAVILPEVTMVTPKIKLHAGSVEVEEDYLEGHLDEDHHLRDFCATLLGECDWQSSRPPSTQTPVMGLLSVTPHDPCSRRAPKVPFDAVVFTERKHSTGDALVLSLGLSADGANTIQDIASRNQGAARERLQQGEVLPCEAGLTKHCESCGVSPRGVPEEVGSPLRHYQTSGVPKERAFATLLQAQSQQTSTPESRAAPHTGRSPRTSSTTASPRPSRRAEVCPAHPPM
ncbi:uncharacterized protein LOC135112360 [Scylla paramamosain]|uniref:uncharacterized protein LOC135112360 n=1 Tax=Scylla paramamosain TaxID=85552 RepID=UPI003082CCFA